MTVKLGLSAKRKNFNLMVFENEVLRRNLYLRERSNSGRRKLHNEEIHNVYFSPDIISPKGCQIMEDEMDGVCNRLGEMHPKFLPENLKGRRWLSSRLLRRVIW
jgi:hypothetical protein